MRGAVSDREAQCVIQSGAKGSAVLGAEGLGGRPPAGRQKPWPPCTAATAAEKKAKREEEEEEEWEGSEEDGLNPQQASVLSCCCWRQTAHKGFSAFCLVDAALTDAKVCNSQQCHGSDPPSDMRPACSTHH